MFEEVETPKVEQEKRCGNIPAKKQEIRLMCIKTRKRKGQF